MRGMYVPFRHVLALVPGGKDIEDALHARYSAYQVEDAQGREVFAIEHLLRRHDVGQAQPVSDPPVLREARLQVIMPLLARPGGVTAGQVAGRLRLSRSSAHRCLAALVVAGLAEVRGRGSQRAFYRVVTD